ncbi:MAG: sulfotransferase family 2 domain-containing protein [Burkholderiaceae bacterium]
MQSTAAASIDDFVTRSGQGLAVSLRLGGHQIDHLPGSDVLVVSFEPAATGKNEPDLDRPVWGQALLLKRGVSVLGVKRVATDWYRNPELHQAFRALQAAGWFRRYAQVLFYGSSMGGYAALAFAACAPGCTVLAFSPQSTLAPERCWFDQRFAGARARRWRGDLVDGVDGAEAAARVYVCYDPHQVKDRLHAQRLPAHNRVDLRLPFVGHTTVQALAAMRQLRPVFDQALAGTLDAAGFRRIARGRAELADHHALLAEFGVYAPRRLRWLDRALALDPQHEAALRLKGVLQPEATPLPEAVPLPAAAEPEPAAELAAAPATEPATEPAAEPGAEPAAETTAPRPAARPRWPMGVVTAERVPLVYLNLPKSGSTTVQNHLLFMASGRYAERPEAIHQHAGLRRSREDDDATHALIGRQLAAGAVVFTFVRDPGRRLYACFNEKIVQTGRHSFVTIRHELERDWGLRFPTAGEAMTLAQWRENFGRFVAFVEANVAGDTSIRRDPHWCPQSTMLAQYKKQFKIDVVGHVESFAADMAQILHRAGVHRIPDLQFRPWRHPAPPFSFEETMTPEVQARLDWLYEGDYTHFGYRKPP